MNLSLVRYRYNPKFTQGVLLADGEWIADTLELPWKDNHVDLSSIPEGDYEIVYDKSKNFPRYKVEGVEGRTGIFIHGANEVTELLGCIAIGIRSKETLIDSQKTLSSIIGIIGASNLLDIRHI